MTPHHRVMTWGTQGCQLCAFEVGTFSGFWEYVNRAGKPSQRTGHAEPTEAGFLHVLSPQPPRGVGVWD